MKKVLLLSLALILLLGIMSHGTSSYFSDRETSAGNTFTAWVGCTCTTFNVSNDDGSIDMLFQYDIVVDPITNLPTLMLRGSFDLAKKNQLSKGVAVVGEHIYVLDQDGKNVYEYDCCGTYQRQSATFKKKSESDKSGAGIGNPYALAIDGANNILWVVVWGANEWVIYGYLMDATFWQESGTVNATTEILLDGANHQPTGMAFGNDYIFTVDKATLRFYRYPSPGGVHDPGLVVASKELKDMGGTLLQSPAGVMFGAMFGGTYLWVVDQDTDKIYGYDLTNLFNGSGSINAVFEFTLNITVDPKNEKATGM